MGSPVHGGLDREGDELFHFFGGHAIGFGHDNDSGGIQVGEHINLGVERGVGSPYHQQHGGYQDEQPVVQGKMYDFV